MTDKQTEHLVAKSWRMAKQIKYGLLYKNSHKEVSSSDGNADTTKKGKN